MPLSEPKRILIVDSSAALRLSLRCILLEAGHEVVGEAKSCLEAIQLYQSLQPDLVTMGLELADSDGITALRAIKQIAPAARVVMCPAMGQKSQVVQAIQEGALDFIIKPFLSTRVLESVEKHAA